MKIPAFILTGHLVSSVTIGAVAQTQADSCFWAARYVSHHNDLSLGGKMPADAMFPTETTSYSYYIQYGDNVFIKVRDPGVDAGILPITVVKYDYPNDKCSYETIMDLTRSYFVIEDTIPPPPDSGLINVSFLCNSEKVGLFCDSAIVNIGEIHYLLVLSDSFSNIQFFELFYPQVKHLPKYIISTDGKRVSKSLDELIFGKGAIDTILENYGHEGYRLISEEELQSSQKQFPPELILQQYEEMIKD